MAATDLPQSLCDLIDRVVRRVRLWPSEKREVRAELESHFREGLIELTQEGLSADQAAAVLSNRFGDPKLAAKLIRRGKKRGRTMIWKVFVRTTVVVVLGIFATCGYAAWLSFGKPSPSVDYIARINEPIERIPYQDRAWPLLREAFLEFQPPPQELLEQMSGVSRLPQPGQAAWDLASEWVRANRSLIPDLQRAANKPAFGFVYGNVKSESGDFLRRLLERDGKAEEAARMAELAESEPESLSCPLLSMLMPHLREFRNITRFLILNSREHLARGEFIEGWTSLDIGHGLGAHLLEGYALIEQLVGASIITGVTQEMRALLAREQGDIAAEQWALVMNSHLMAMSAGTIKPDYTGERQMFEDVVQWVFTDDGTGDGHLIPREFPMDLVSGDSPGGLGRDAAYAALAVVHAGRKETLAKHAELWEKMEDALSLPLYDPKRDEVADALEKSFNDPATRYRYWLIFVVLPSLRNADTVIRESAMDQAATQTVAVLLQYRNDHGRFPAALDALVPAYLKDVPVDAFDGRPLKYSIDQGGRVSLYSIGRNFEDDGGSTEMAPERNRPDVKAPADIVYWPPNTD